MPDFGEPFFIDVIRNGHNEDPWNSDVSVARWKPPILRQLEKISQSESGLALLNAIKAVGRFVAIVPPLIEVTCNARTQPVDPPRDMASPSKGRTYVAVVEYDADRFASSSACNRSRVAHGEKFGVLPDEILFHELVHAFCDASGVRRSTSPMVKGAEGVYGSTGEFLAVVLTNIYISDITNRGSSGLRANHIDHFGLDKAVSTSVSFFKSNSEALKLLKEFAANAPALARDLCGVKASFNPIRALFDPSIQPLLAELAASQFAHRRDLEDRHVGAVRKAERDVAGAAEPWGRTVAGAVQPWADAARAAFGPAPDLKGFGRSAASEFARELGQLAIAQLAR